MLHLDFFCKYFRTRFNFSLFLANIVEPDFFIDLFLRNSDNSITGGRARNIDIIANQIIDTFVYDAAVIRQIHLLQCNTHELYDSIF